MTEKEAHISVGNLTMAYGDFVLMRDLTLTINQGDIFIVMGGQRLRQKHHDDHFDRLEGPGQGKSLLWRASCKTHQNRPSG